MRALILVIALSTSLAHADVHYNTVYLRTSDWRYRPTGLGTCDGGHFGSTVLKGVLMWQPTTKGIIEYMVDKDGPFGVTVPLESGSSTIVTASEMEGDTRVITQIVANKDRSGEHYYVVVVRSKRRCSDSWVADLYTDTWR